MKSTLEDELKQIRRRRASSNYPKRSSTNDAVTKTLVYGVSLLAVILTVIAIAQTINHFYR